MVIYITKSASIIPTPKVLLKPNAPENSLRIQGDISLIRFDIG